MQQGRASRITGKRDALLRSRRAHVQFEATTILKPCSCALIRLAFASPVSSAKTPDLHDIPGGGRDRKTTDGLSRRRANILLLRLKRAPAVSLTHLRTWMPDKKKWTHFFERIAVELRAAPREKIRVSKIFSVSPGPGSASKFRKVTCRTQYCRPSSARRGGSRT
jgi:hypothetical protein